MDHRTIRVLLVDDEEDFLGVLDRRLRWRGLEVTRARTGAEALDALAEFPADVVVLDLKMPGMDGLETLRQIKRAHPLVEVVMLTGHACMESAVEGIRIGAFDYLMKPLNVEALLLRIEDACRHKTLSKNELSGAE